MMKSRMFTLKEHADWFVEGLEAAQVEWVQLIDMHYYPNRYIVEWKV